MIWFLIYLILFFIGYIIFYNIKVRDKILGWRNRAAGRLDVKGCITICFLVFIGFTLMLAFILESIQVAAILAMLPAIGTYSLFDLKNRFTEDREMKQITFFLMTMSKWSGVRNDLVYCLKKTGETNMKKPMGEMISTTLGRIYGGMAPASALGLLEKEARSEDFRYLVKNIRFAAEKGGSLQELFAGMEEQYFRIDEEYFKRKISTLRDRTAVYLTVLLVIGTGIWFIGNNPVARTFYMETARGNMLLALFVLLFGTGIMVMIKR